MKIRQLECFCALAETLNFTQAAQKIYMTQSAFSKNIASLENELGCTLIVRSKVDPCLTEAGKLIYPRAKNIINESQRIRDIAISARKGELQEIRIGVLWGGMHKYEREIIAEFSLRYENVSIDVTECSVNDLFQMLDFESIDFAIYNGQYQPFLNQYHRIILENNEICLICNKHHKFAGREAVAMDELRDENFISLKQDKGEIALQDLEGLCSKGEFTPKIVEKVNSAMIILNYVELGKGVAIMGGDIVPMFGRELRAIPIKGQESSSHWLLSRKHDTRPAVQSFRSFVSEKVNSSPSTA